MFWKLLAHLPAEQLLAHRIVWAAFVLLLLLVVRRRLGELRAIRHTPGVLRVLLVTTGLISVNWLIFIWAILTDRILEASLGYYINPLITVLLGLVFLGESLSRAQWLSVVLAGIGVSVLVVTQGGLPWIALALALTFGFYSLLRKRVRAEAMAGLALETGILAPAALTYLGVCAYTGSGAFGQLGAEIDSLLALSGLITALPLILFTYGARRLPLSTVGLLQYLAPTVQFLLAVTVYHEPFTARHLAAFVVIWCALALFTWDLRMRARSRHRALNPQQFAQRQNR